MKLRIRKATEADFRAYHLYTDTEAPAYAAVSEMRYHDDDEAEVALLAVIVREKMAGSGSCNMWGSPYRWALHTYRRDLLRRARNTDRTPNIHGVCTYYFDTLGDARDSIAEKVWTDARDAWAQKEEVQR